MAKPSFLVQPQRSDGRGYIPCELHQATSFAVIRMEKLTRKGKAYTASRVIGRYPTRNQAQAMADCNVKATTPLARQLVRKLGQRIIN